MLRAAAIAVFWIALAACGRPGGGLAAGDGASSLERLRTWSYKLDAAPHDPSLAPAEDDTGWRPLADLARDPALADEGRPRAMWLRTLLPPAPRSDWADPAIYVQQIRRKVEAYVDGRLVYAFGRVADAAASDDLGDAAHFFRIPHAALGQTLVLRVRAAAGPVGPHGEALVGERAEILARLVRQDVPRLMLGVLPLVLGLAALAFYAIALQARVALSYAALCLVIGAWQVTHVRLTSLMVGLPRGLDFAHLMLASLALVAAADTVSRVVPEFGRKLLVRGAAAILPVTAALACVLSLAGAVELYRANAALVALLALVALPLAVETHTAIRAGHAAARAAAGGLLAVLAAAVHDALARRGYLPWHVEVVDVAAAGLALALSPFVARRVKEEAVQRRLRERDVETAALLQGGFLPARLVETEAFALTAYSRPAVAFGGDWFAHRLVAGRWLHIHVGDVAGTGTRAALLAAFAKGAVDHYYASCRARGEAEPALDALHDELNGALCETGKGEATMTLASVAIDLDTGDVLYVNSGHVAPIVCHHAEDRAERLPGRNGNLLGFDPGFRSEPPHHSLLREGESLLVHTNGVYDLLAKDGRRASEREATRLLQPADALDVQLAVRKHDIADDATLVTVRLKPAAPLSVASGA